jgi:hypothetical protein
VLLQVGFLRYRRQLIIMVTLQNVLCITAMKRADPVNPENAAEFRPAPVRKESDSIIRDMTETPEGVKVMKFRDFDLRTAVQQYDAIRVADLQFQSGTLLGRADDDDGKGGGPSDPKRIRTTTDKRPNDQGSTLMMGVSLLAHIFVYYPDRLTEGSIVDHLQPPIPPAPQANFSIDFDAFGKDDEDAEELSTKPSDEIELDTETNERE